MDRFGRVDVLANIAGRGSLGAAEEFSPTQLREQMEVNFITDANDLGDTLTAHPDVAKISFTGLTATRRKVMASASNTLKRVTLELGGNDAGIVLDEVDPAAVAPAIFEGVFQNSGQVCLALKRLYVHESVYDRMCDGLAKIADATIVDDGLKQGTKLGPLQNKMRCYTWVLMGRKIR